MTQIVNSYIRIIALIRKGMDAAAEMVTIKIYLSTKTISMNKQLENIFQDC